MWTESRSVLFLDEEERQWLGVKLRQLQKLDDIHPSIPGLTLGEKRMRHTHFCGDLTLREVCLFAGRNESPQKCVVSRLIGRRPGLSGFASFGGRRLLHIPSVGNA